MTSESRSIVAVTSPTPAKLQQFILIVRLFGIFKIETFHEGVQHVLEGRLRVLSDRILSFKGIACFSVK